MGLVICHRQFDGEHEDSENCWCRPIALDADITTEEDVDKVVAELNQEDG